MKYIIAGMVLVASVALVYFQITRRKYHDEMFI